MEHIEWSPSHRVGHAGIDGDHQALVSIANRLIDMLGAAAPRALFGGFNELLCYAERHFSVEEELMQRHAFPGLPAHAAEHERFVGTVHLLNQRVRSGDRQACDQILEFVKGWYASHVLGTDRQYMPCLAEEGPLAAAPGLAEAGQAE